MKESVIITGACGGIGSVLVSEYLSAGYRVIATDSLHMNESRPDVFFFQIDLRSTVVDTVYRDESLGRIRSALEGTRLVALVNNAAEQIVKEFEMVTLDDWESVLRVNLLAPFFWTQFFLSDLTSNQGSVLNISSVHARQTKSQFSVYATSKAALSGLTRLLAIELGDRVRVNAIEPGAISTKMLEEGFKAKHVERQLLNDYHPRKSIGTPIEVANLALFLTSRAASFMNGSVVSIDGGVGNRLHDPAN